MVMALVTSALSVLGDMIGVDRDSIIVCIIICILLCGPKRDHLLVSCKKSARLGVPDVWYLPQGRK